MLRFLDSFIYSAYTHLLFIYASPSSGEAYSDRQLTPNFELWVEFFFVCRHVSIWGFRNLVCPYPEKKYHPCFDNTSPTVVNVTWLERSLKVLKHGTNKIYIYIYIQIATLNKGLIFVFHFYETRKINIIFNL